MLGNHLSCTVLPNLGSTTSARQQAWFATVLPSHDKCCTGMTHSSEHGRETQEGIMRGGETHGLSGGHEMSQRWSAACLSTVRCRVALEISEPLIRPQQPSLILRRCCRFGRVPNYSFSFRLDNGETWEIVFTAVRGHVMEHAFPPHCKNWSGYPTKQLFDTPIEKRVQQVRAVSHPDTFTCTGTDQHNASSAALEASQMFLYVA